MMANINIPNVSEKHKKKGTEGIKFIHSSPFWLLQDPVYYADRYQETHVLRNVLIGNLRDIGVHEITPRVANFVMCHLEPSGSAVASVVSEFRTQGVFLRDVSFMGTDVGSRALRITVKDKHRNRVIIETLDYVLNTVLPHQCRQRCR